MLRGAAGIISRERIAARRRIRVGSRDPGGVGAERRGPAVANVPRGGGGGGKKSPGARGAVGAGVPSRISVEVVKRPRADDPRRRPRVPPGHVQDASVRPRLERRRAPYPRVHADDAPAGDVADEGHERIARRVPLPPPGDVRELVAGAQTQDRDRGHRARVREGARVADQLRDPGDGAVAAGGDDAEIVRLAVRRDERDELRHERVAAAEVLVEVDDAALRLLELTLELAALLLGGWRESRAWGGGDKREGGEGGSAWVSAGKGRKKDAGC